jgi:hypothetical protein
MAFTGFPRAISWKDFTEVDAAPDGSDEEAYTKAKWNVSYGFPAGTGDYTVNNIVVSMTMVKTASWVVKGSQSDDLLKHEQGHFDITSLGGRDIHRELSNITAKSLKELKAAIAKLISDTEAAVAALNDTYDDKTKGTDHGADAKAQTRWSSKIATAIADPDATLDSIG